MTLGFFSWRQQVTQILNQINKKEDAIMSGLSDLQANVATLQANVTALANEQATLIKDIQAALANNVGDSDAAVEAVAQIVAQEASAVAALTVAQQAADPATPPAPAPSGS